ncbi:MAG: hypothetical protein ABW034_07355 [Steroidobacteraceae bacterium]
MHAAKISRLVEAGCSTVAIERIARALAISPRTLQRRLEDESTKFIGLLDAERRDVASSCLKDANVAIKDEHFLSSVSAVHSRDASGLSELGGVRIALSNSPP